jgi:thiol-disulfide isomerase/thioredoxin
VQVLLWIIFALDLLFGWIQIPVFDRISLMYFLMTVCIYGIFMLGINILAPVWNKERFISYLKQEINSIKANEKVFTAILSQQPRYAVSRLDSRIVFGNPEANLQLTVLTNPFCNPCATMHRRIEKLLKETNNALGVQYIFASFDVSLDFANKYLIAAYLEKDPTVFRQIIGEWFEKGKPLKDAFFKDFAFNMNNPEIETEFQKH